MDDMPEDTTGVPARLDRVKLLAFVLALVLGIAWLLVLPWWLWQHGAHLAALVPWALDLLGLAALLLGAARSAGRPAALSSRPLPPAVALSASPGRGTSSLPS